MKNCFRMEYLREQVFGKLPFLSPLESFLVRCFMIPNLVFLQAEGLEHIRDRKGPFIFACNHNNSIESLFVPAFLIYHSGGRKISFVIDWMFGKIPLLGFLMDIVEPVYVYHKRSPLKFLEWRRPKQQPSADTVSLCCDKLSAGKRIGIFPEGKRNRNPHTLMQAKPGVGHIALRSGVPVIPVGIDCVSGKKKKKVHSFGRIILKIGEPMRFDDHVENYRNVGRSACPSASGNLERRMLALTVTNRIMKTIAGLCGKEYPQPAAPVGNRHVSVENPKNDNHTIKEGICPV